MAKIGYLGHSVFTLEMGGLKVLTDPFITPNPLASSVDLKSISADIILVSHGHQDHTADLMTLAMQTDATVVSNHEISNWVVSNGHSRVVGMNHGGVFRHKGLTIKMVNAVHSSSFTDGKYAGNPAGFVISNEDYCAYFAGDTALSMDMKLIGEEFTVDVAMLPIGDLFTMGFEDACRAAGFVKTKTVIGMHYDSFPPIVIDHHRAKEHFQKNGIELLLMGVGEERMLNR